MSNPTVVFPLSEIQTEFLQSRNQRAIDMVQDAVRKVALDANVPTDVKVAPNESLTALVMVPREAPPAPPAPPEAPAEPVVSEDVLEAAKEAFEARQATRSEPVDAELLEDQHSGEPV